MIDAIVLMRLFEKFPRLNLVEERKGLILH